MNDFLKALIFGPGLQRSGVWGDVVVAASGLQLDVAEQRQHIAWPDITLREVGFGDNGIEFSWQREGQAWAAHVLDAAAARALLAMQFMMTLPQAQHLQSQQRRHKTGRVVGWSVLGLLILSPLLLLALFFMQADRLAGWVADRIPIEEEIRFGRAAFNSLKTSLKLHDSGPAYEAVNTIGKRLTQGSKYSYEFHVVSDDTLNAFAMPGGIVVVHTGLINATTRPEELAGVLAHEVQHVEQRHSVHGLIKQLGLQAIWVLISGDLSGTLASQAALQLTSLKFSRDAETQADTKGFETLVQQGIDPSGMPAFFKIMSEKAVDAPAAFLSTHPLSADRQALLARRVAELNQRAFTPLNIQPWPP